MWLYLTPLWAVLTAWLGKDPARPREVPPPSRGGAPELLRIAMCACGVTFLVALSRLGTETWIPLILATWLLGLVADYVERGVPDAFELVIAGGAPCRLGAARVRYVCLAWVFFRAESFDNALAILRQLATLETDHANLVPIVTTALVAGFACHFWAERQLPLAARSVHRMPSWGQGLVLAAAALVLRDLGHAKIVPFIYFQF